MFKVFQIILMLFVSISSYSQSSRVKVQIPTPEQECGYIWRNIQDISFFDKNGYSVSFPDHPFVNSLLDKARKGKLQNESYDSLFQIMKNEIYNKEDYNNGYQKIVNVIPEIDQAVNEMEEFKELWGFRMFEQYVVTLSLYGPGGSYDPDRGTVLMMTRKDGSFKGYSDPENTIIHEIVHMGIEYVIVRKFNLTHFQKERLVDLFVKICFGDRLPLYQIQGFGDNRVDKIIKTKKDLIELPELMTTFKN